MNPEIEAILSSKIDRDPKGVVTVVESDYATYGVVLVQGVKGPRLLIEDSSLHALSPDKPDWPDLPDGAEAPLETTGHQWVLDLRRDLFISRYFEAIEDEHSVQGVVDAVEGLEHGGTLDVVAYTDFLTKLANSDIEATLGTAWQPIDEEIIGLLQRFIGKK